MARASGLPLRVLDRIEPAGGSAYAWADQELTAWLDPSGRWTLLSNTLLRVGLVALVLAWSAAAGWHQMWAGIALLVVAGFGLIRERGLLLPWWAAAVAVLLADVTTLLTVAGLVLLAGVGLLSMLGQARHRSFALTVTATLTALGHLGPTDPVRALVVAVVAPVVGLAVLWRTSGRRLPLPFGRVTPEHLGLNPPFPPSTVPWLVKRRSGNAAKMDRLPAEIKRKQAGAYGERRTALLLLGLRRRRGTRIGHDVDLPGADSANVDHFVLTRAGVFVLDSKQYGTAADPGQVMIQGSEIVHRTNRGSRALTSSLNTAAWATEAVSGTLGVPGRGVLVIHRAAVQPGLTYTRADGVEVDVIAADVLIDRIDGAPATLNRSTLTNAIWRASKLRSSTTHRAPHLSTPLGVRGAPRKPTMWEPDLERERVENERARQRNLLLETGEPEEEEEEEAPEREQGLGGQERGAAEHPALPEPAGGLAPGAMEYLNRLPEAMQDQVKGNWKQMTLSERADPGDVEADLRTLSRGEVVEIVEFADGDLRTSKMVALTGPCQGVNGAYIWVCRPENWRVYQEHGKPVFVATVSTDKVIRLGAKST